MENLVEIFTSEDVLITLLISACAGGVTFLIAWALIASGFRSRRDALASQTWPFVIGAVVAARVTESRSSSNSSNTFSPLITYEYEVRGQHYRSSNRSFAGDMEPADQGYAQSVVAHYLSNPLVTVYYDPSDPARAALDRKIGNAWKITVGVGVGLVLFVLCLIVVLLAAQVIPMLTS